MKLIGVERIIGGFIEEITPTMNPHHTLMKSRLEPWRSMEKLEKDLDLSLKKPNEPLGRIMVLIWEL